VEIGVDHLKYTRFRLGSLDKINPGRIMINLKPQGHFREISYDEDNKVLEEIYYSDHNRYCAIMNGEENEEI
jgi:hypothetical protein